ncbi:MAG: hypothetical protein IT204_19960 [Fimbriimonadaceae bacterium]|nr:hypothetical protein [Fimbriimonadaceae bacterium]
MPTTLAALLLSAAPTPEGFAPPGLWTWDNWFARDGDTYHAYYLSVASCIGDPNDWGLRSGLVQIGHATSSDLRTWTDQGPVLVPQPRTPHSVLATGSVARHGDRWWMAYSAHGTPAGIGMLESTDLYRWQRVAHGDGVVVPRGTYTGTFEGQPLRWEPLADPFLYPEPINGKMVIVINARALDVPHNESGCLATLESTDLLHWTPGPVLAFPRFGERLETPQLWHHGGRWYLLTGVAHDQPAIAPRWVAELPAPTNQHRRANLVLQADRYEGPYRLVGNYLLDRLPGGRFGYIHKLVSGPDGQDYLLTSSNNRLSLPFPVTYAADGSLELHDPR